MGLDFDYQEGQTPLDEDEKEGLLLPAISTRVELDEFEQLGVENAIAWLNKRKLSPDKILTNEFVRRLHKRMFGTIWKWAGEFRTTNKNIGVDKFSINIELKNLLDDGTYWIANKTFLPDEIAVRISHRIVAVHPFANRNGRHSRLYADTFIHNGFGLPYFSWGSKSLNKQGEARTQYLSALREADKQNYEPLLKFARQ